MIQKSYLLKIFIKICLLVLLLVSPVIGVFYLGGFPICIEKVAHPLLFNIVISLSLVSFFGMGICMVTLLESIDIDKRNQDETNL